MNETDEIKKFAGLLESAGYERALELIKDELVPLAQQHGLSLYEAARMYANADEEQDTSWFQLAEALRNLPNLAEAS